MLICLNVYFAAKYLRTNCISECYIRKAKTYCGCIPWDYPTMLSNESVVENFLICDFFGKSCFNSYLESGLAKSCKQTCYANCNEVKYSIALQVEKIDRARICSFYDNAENTDLSPFEIEVLKKERHVTLELAV